MSLKDLMINAKTGAEAYMFFRKHESARRQKQRLKIKEITKQENGKVEIKPVENSSIDTAT
jgi:hypothetical protein